MIRLLQDNPNSVKYVTISKAIRKSGTVCVSKALKDIMPLECNCRFEELIYK